MPAKKDNQKERLKVDAMEYFMNDVFQNHLITKNHIDTKINWLMGISAIIMSLLLPYIIKNDNSINHFALIIIALSALLSFVICLISLEMPSSFIRNRPEEESVMFYSAKSYKTSVDIYNDLKRIGNYDDVLKQYSKTLYNLIERNIKLKNKLFKLASKMLFTGLLMGFLIAIVGLF